MEQTEKQRIAAVFDVLVQESTPNVNANLTDEIIQMLLASATVEEVKSRAAQLGISEQFTTQVIERVDEPERSSGGGPRTVEAASPTDATITENPDGSITFTPAPGTVFEGGDGLSPEEQLAEFLGIN